VSAAETVVRLLHDVDRRDWAAIRAGLADVVRCDYTSLFGGEVEELPADELVARWQGLLPGFDATQHLLGPLVPAADPPADGVWLECNVRGYHRLGDREWLVAGRYRIRVDGGTAVSGITLDTSYQSGDTGLPEEASRRLG
jgi:hypothetical protein